MTSTATHLSRQVLCAAAMACLGMTQALAAPVIYTDRNVFTAAATGLSTVDFGNTTGFGWVGDGLTSGGLTFNAPLSHYLYVAGAQAVGNSYQWNSGSSLLFGSTNEGGNLVIHLPGGVHTFGFDFMAEADGAPDATGGLRLNVLVDGQSYSGLTQARPGRAFFGISSVDDLSTVTLTLTNTKSFRVLPIIDNVSYSALPTAGQVPEPGSLALVGLALLGAVAARRRQR